MEKAIHSADYRAFLRLLKKTRKEKGISQVELATRLSKAHDPISQSLLSKLERGEVRIDIIQLRWICESLEITLVDFVRALEGSLPKKRKK
jgi:transcriptional regulator with XRE-family HTH domain